MRETGYDRQKVYEYAKKWALKRNPDYYNFDPVGGDCTNFVSQCIYAGSGTMNYSQETGWYYNNGNNKSPAWTGVPFLHQFLTQNKGVGPYGKEVSKSEIELGDIAQIAFLGNQFVHSVVIVKIEEKEELNKIYTASHTYDTFEKRLGTYSYSQIRFIKIQGVRNW